MKYIHYSDHQTQFPVRSGMEDLPERIDIALISEVAVGSCAASQTHFVHTMSTPEVGSPEWLSSQLTTLLASPHIHFTQPSFPGLKLRMGPGPIDVFSTRFTNMCTKDVTGVLGGQEVDKAGLKEGLLALQKKWTGNGVQVESAQAPEGFQVCSFVPMASC